MAGNSAQELVPGDESPALGATLGIQGGARFSLFEAYLDQSAFLRGGSITRAVGGLGSVIGLVGARVYLRGGVGFLNQTNGALTGAGADASGLCLRGGVGLEKTLTRALLLGFGVDGEYYALRVPALDETATGGDVIGSLHLGFEVGI